MKNVLMLGASGLLAPHITPFLESDYCLHLADIKPHPDGKPVAMVDVTCYPAVREACRGMDAVVNLTVLRDDPVLSFEVNSKGAYHVMRAAAETGVRKVVHTGPYLIPRLYLHDFEIDDVPPAPGTSYYFLTKYLSLEICRIYARAYRIQTICLLFGGLGPRPTEPVAGHDLPIFYATYDDIAHALRLALEVESVHDDFQSFNILSYTAQDKYRIDKAKRLLGYEPLERWEEDFRGRENDMASLSGSLAKYIG